MLLDKGSYNETNYDSSPVVSRAPIKKKRKTQEDEIVETLDLWCGGGGTTTGLIEAFTELGYNFSHTGINHWTVAVASFQKNHPEARTLCKSVDHVNFCELYPKKRIKLLVASPECIGHSKARGGKPTTEQKRADAWDIQRLLERVYVENLIIENVAEFMDWGPLKEDGTPDKRHKGKCFKQFIEFLEMLYTVEYRILNCADYGDPTTRRRFFLIARRPKGKKIFFPEPTHASRALLAKRQPDMFGQNELKPWVPARAIIDWNAKGKNVFGRKKPLTGSTMKRIFAGLRKFSGIDVPEREIFAVKSLFDLLPKKEQEKRAKEKITSLDAADFEKKLKKLPHVIAPLSETIKRDKKGEIIEHQQFPGAESLEELRAERQAAADAVYLKAPIKLDRKIFEQFGESFLFNMKASDRRMRSINEPTFTQTANSQHQYLAQPYFYSLAKAINSDGKLDARSAANLPEDGYVHPFMVQYFGGATAQSVDNPMPTITANYEHYALTQPCLIKYHGGDDAPRRNYSVDEPLATIDTSNRFAVVKPFMLGVGGAEGQKIPHDIDNPMKTITGTRTFAVVKPVLVPTNHGEGDTRTHSIDEPMGTITSVDALGMTQSFIVKFNNNQDAQDLNEPFGTLTTKEKFGIGDPFFIQFYGERDGQEPRTRGVDEPLWTVTPQVRMGIVEPFLVKMENIKNGEEVHGLLLLELGAILIVNFRMLMETELAAAMSFPPEYEFSGTRDQKVRQIGNAVPCKTAKALCRAAVGG